MMFKVCLVYYNHQGEIQCHKFADRDMAIKHRETKLLDNHDVHLVFIKDDGSIYSEFSP